MTIENFKGYRSRQINMPDGGCIVCYFYVDIGHPTNVEDGNRNVFRVDKNGQVLWQVTRVDYPETNWNIKHQMARAQGLPGCIEPFIRFYLIYPDGTRNKGAPMGILPDVADWVPGCQVEMANLGVGTQWFSLDVDTGVATEITLKDQRPW